jgi:hypothetical protein
MKEVNMRRNTLLKPKLDISRLTFVIGCTLVVVFLAPFFTEWAWNAFLVPVVGLHPIGLSGAIALLFWIGILSGILQLTRGGGKE